MSETTGDADLSRLLEKGGNMADHRITITLRLREELYRLLVKQADNAGMRLNEWATRLLEIGSQNEQRQWGAE